MADDNGISVYRGRVAHVHTGAPYWFRASLRSEEPSTRPVGGEINFRFRDVSPDEHHLVAIGAEFYFMIDQRGQERLTFIRSRP